MARVDSFDKIVEYFGVVTKISFTYKGIVYKPKVLHYSDNLFRGYTCPSNCGACCPRFSLDYLPTEEHPYKLQRKVITFNECDTFVLFTDSQSDATSHFCKHVDRATGRCGIHGKHPFSCDFELLRFLKFKDPTRENLLMTKLYGRRGNATSRWSY